MQDLLGRLNISGFDAESYITDHAKNASALPNIAIAVSGGGYRACLNGGGAVQAFDSREINATAAGHLGGLLQSATYLAGLSGGGWLVGSIFVNNFTTITGLLDNDASSVWEFGNSIFEGPDSGSIQYVRSPSICHFLSLDELPWEASLLQNVSMLELSYQISSTDGDKS